MPRNGTDAEGQGQSWLEAIAHWRLALHTEVKRSSSLPTAMFDACDPTLESRLVATAEAMLAQLQDPAPTVATGDEHAEQRLETVTADELRALPRQIGTDFAPLDLLSGLSAEYLGTLADTCCRANGVPQRRAVELLSRDFAVGPAADLDQLTKLLAQQTDAALGADARATSGEELAATCQRIAAAVILHTPLPPRSPS